MVSPWEVYLLLKLDSFQSFFIMVGLLGGLVSLGLFIIASASVCDQDFPKIPKIVSILFFLSPLVPAASLLLGTLIPDTKQAAVIYAAPRVLNSEFVQKDVPAEAKELYGLAKQWLEEQAGRKKEK